MGKALESWQLTIRHWCRLFVPCIHSLSKAKRTHSDIANEGTWLQTLTHFLSFLAVLSELALGFKENVNTQYSSVRKLSEVMHTLTNAQTVRARVRRLDTGHHHRGQRKGYWRHLRINITPNQYTSLDLTLKLINIFIRLFQNSIFSLYGSKTHC